MCDIDKIGKSSWLVNQVTAGIGAILSNKYLGGLGTADPESKTLKTVLEFWGKQLASGTSLEYGSDLPFRAYSAVGFYILAGAFVRMDRTAVKLVPAIHEAVASPHKNGDVVANSCSILIRSIPFLSTENHAVVKPLFKQWLYSHMVKPLYSKALPPAKGLEASRCTVAILSIVEHCPFSVYEADLDPLVRLLVTAMSQPAGAAEASSLTQATAALHILLDILSSDPSALLPHLNTLVNGAVQLHSTASTLSNNAALRKDPTLAACRRLALQLLGALPGKFEERHLLSHAPQTQRMLAKASGDPARDVRKVALVARETWAKVA